jgi:hypothetical protein
MEGKGMMGMMKPSSIVASNDGGVIVMTGNKLQKYDKNLNLVKEVEIKVDAPMDCAMGGKKMCPMCQKMMDKKGGMDPAMPAGNPEAAPSDAHPEHEGPH